MAKRQREEKLESRREQRKAELRQRIIAAGREIIREAGSEGLSMRALALRAGVSLTTPYNLFGSKAAVMVAMLNLGEYTHQLRQFDYLGAVDRIFVADDLSISFYTRDPDFYKAMWRELMVANGSLRSVASEIDRQPFWRDFVDRCYTEGIIDPRIDAGLLARQLDHQFFAVIQTWVIGEIPDVEVACEVKYGHAMILAGAAQASARDRLHEQAIAFQTQLMDLRTAVPALQ